MKYGFTGTKKGMTEKQKHAFLFYIDKLKWPFYQGDDLEFHIGDCVGADTDAYKIWKMYFDMNKIGFIHIKKYFISSLECTF